MPGSGHTSNAHGQAYDALEVFAGVASLSKCLRCSGLRGGSLEIEFWWEYAQVRRLPKSMGNPMDLLTALGMALLGFSSVLTHYHSLCKQII